MALTKVGGNSLTMLIAVEIIKHRRLEMRNLLKKALNKFVTLCYLAVGDREVEWLASKPAVQKIYRRLEMYSTDNRALEFLATVNEHKMYVYAGQYRKFLSGQTYEKETTQVFSSLLNKGDVVIDVGAYFGYYTLLGARLVGEKGIVFAFEPNQQSYELLVKNIKLNGYQNVTPINRAVASTSGTASFF